MKPGHYRHHPLVYILLSLLLLQTTSFRRLQPRKVLPHPLPSLVDKQSLCAPDASSVETLVSLVGLLARRFDGWMLLTHDGPDFPQSWNLPLDRTSLQHHFQHSARCSRIQGVPDRSSAQVLMKQQLLFSCNKHSRVQEPGTALGFRLRLLSCFTHP